MAEFSLSDVAAMTAAPPAAPAGLSLDDVARMMEAPAPAPAPDGPPPGVSLASWLADHPGARPPPRAADAPPPAAGGDRVAPYGLTGLITGQGAASPPPEGGFWHNQGVGTRAALSGILGMGAPLYDLAALPQNLVNKGVKAATGYDLGLSTSSGGELLDKGLDAVGLPRPQTLAEQRASRLVEGMAGVIPSMAGGLALKALGPVNSTAARMADMLLAKPATQLASGAGAGALSEAASEGGSGPLGQTVAGLAGAVLGGAGASALGSTARIGQSLVQPFTQAGRQAIVADTILRQSANPAGLQARLLAARLDPTLRLPDSPVTTAQAAADPGLNALESGLRSDAQAPPGAGGLSPQATFANVDTARNAARAAALPAPAPEAAATLGGQLRDTLVDAQGQRQAAVSKAYEAVDPFDESYFPSNVLKGRAVALEDKYYGDMSGGLPRGLDDVMRDIRGAPDALPWRSMQNLHGRLVALADQFPGDARAQAVIAQLKQSIDDAGAQAARPIEPPSTPMTQADIARDYAAEGAAQRPDVAQAIAEETVPAWERSPGAGANDTPPAYQGLAQFLISKGGIQNQGGEVMHMLGSTRARPALVNNVSGLPLDRARELAHEAGFLGSQTEVSGAGSSTTSDLIEALRSDLNNPGPKAGTPPASLGDQVQAELDQRGLNVSLAADPAEKVLSAVRDPAMEQPANAPAPDGYAPLESPFTPQQGQQWQQARDLRLQLGQDVGPDNTGARAVANILQRGPGGGWNLQDGNVLGQALATPDAARQALRMGGDAALPQLRQGFMDRAFGATAAPVPAVDGNPAMRAPGFLRFWNANQDVARVIFPPDQLSRLDQLANDFAETASSQASARARGSDTARNLSVANVIARASNGLVDPSNTAVQALMAPVAAVAKFTGAEGAIKHLLVEAMADPALASRLLAKATPEGMARAQGYIGDTMAGRFGQAAGDAAGRTAVRGAEAGAAAEQPSAAPVPRVSVPLTPAMLPIPANSDARRRADLAQRLMTNR